MGAPPLSGDAAVPADSGQASFECLGGVRTGTSSECHAEGVGGPDGSRRVVATGGGRPRGLCSMGSEQTGRGERMNHG